MKKVILTTLCAAFVACAFAQGQGQRQAPVYPSDDLVKYATLTGDEVTKLKANEETYTQALQKAIQDAGQDFTKMQTAMQAARALRVYGIKQILTDKEKYAKYLEGEIIYPSFGGFGGMTGGQRRQGQGGGGGNFGGGGGGGNFGGGGGF